MKGQEFGHVHSPRLIILRIWHAQVQQSALEKLSICPHHVLCFYFVFTSQSTTELLSVLILQHYRQRGFPARETERKRVRRSDCISSHTLCPHAAAPTLLSVFSLSLPLTSVSWGDVHVATYFPEHIWFHPGEKPVCWNVQAPGASALSVIHIWEASWSLCHKDKNN